MIGLELGAAQRRLSALGLTVRVRMLPGGGGPVMRVVGQDPAPNTVLGTRRNVSLTYRRSTR